MSGQSRGHTVAVQQHSGPECEWSIDAGFSVSESKKKKKNRRGPATGIRHKKRIVKKESR